MCFANVFNIYVKWKFYSGNITSDFEKLTFHFAQLVKGTLSKLKNRLSPTHKILTRYLRQGRSLFNVNGGFRESS